MGIEHDRCGISSGRHRLLLRVLLAGLGLVGFQVTHGATWKDGGGWTPAPVSQGSDGVWSVLPDMRSPNNSHVTTCTTSACNRVGDLPAPIGKGNPRLAPSASFPKANIAAGILGLGARALPWISLGTGIYDWYQAAKVRPQDDADGGFEEQTGGKTPTTERWLPTNPSYSADARGSSTTACQAAADWRVAVAMSGGSYSSGSGSAVTTVTGANTINCNVTINLVWKSNGSLQTVNYATNVWTKTAASSCMDSNGYLTPTIGGVCDPGVWTPTTEANAQTKLNNANVTADILRRALDEVLKAGGSINDSGVHSLSGPSSAPGETITKTATAANGTTQVTTVNNTYNYTYNGNTVTVTTTTVTQNPDGSSVSQTTNEPDVDKCVSDPSSAGCAKLGDPGTAELPINTKTVTFTPVTFSANQSCPGPVQFNALGRQLEFSYSPMCDTISTWVRALVLAGCAFIAAFVFIGGLKA